MCHLQSRLIRPQNRQAHAHSYVISGPWLKSKALKGEVVRNGALESVDSWRVCRGFEFHCSCWRVFPSPSIDLSSPGCQLIFPSEAAIMHLNWVISLFLPNPQILLRLCSRPGRTTQKHRVWQQSQLDSTYGVNYSGVYYWMRLARIKACITYKGSAVVLLLKAELVKTPRGESPRPPVRTAKCCVNVKVNGEPCVDLCLKRARSSRYQ